MAVRWGHVKERHVERKCAVPKKSRYAGEKDRGVIGAAVVDRFAHVGSDEERIVAKVRRESRGHLRRRSFGMESDDFDIQQLWGAADEGVQQLVGSHGHFVKIDAMTGLNQLNRLVGLDQRRPRFTVHPRHIVSLSCT